MDSPFTFAMYLQRYLSEHGLLPDQAAAVVNMMRSDKDNPMSGRLNDAVDGYPDMMVSSVLLDARTYAVKWIDANYPEHWARPIFDISGRS